MNISRRKSMWTILGGVFAPAVVQSNTLLDKPSLPFRPPPTNYGVEQADAIKIPVDPFWKQKEIAELKKIANGEYNEHQLRELETCSIYYTTVDAQIDNLKSISNVHKVKMKYDAQIERTKKIWKYQAIYRIKQLMSMI